MTYLSAQDYSCEANRYSHHYPLAVLLHPRHEEILSRSEAELLKVALDLFLGPHQAVLTLVHRIGIKILRLRPRPNLQNHQNMIKAPLQPQQFQFSKEAHPNFYEPNPFPVKEDYTYDEFMQLFNRIVAHQRLIEHLNTNIWEDCHNYETVNVEKVKSAFLDGNDQFQQLVTAVDLFNQEVLNAKEKKQKIRNGVWRLKFYKALSAIIQEIEFFTNNRNLQSVFVEKAYNWAMDTISKVDYQGRKAEGNGPQAKRPPSSNKRPFSSVKRPFSAVTTKTNRPFSGYPTTLYQDGETTLEQSQPGGLMDRIDRPDSGFTENRPMLPSEQISEQLQDYKSGARTQHYGVEEPALRLPRYKRRQIQNLIPPRPMTAVKPEQKSAFPKAYSAKPELTSKKSMDAPIPEISPQLQPQAEQQLEQAQKDEDKQLQEQIFNQEEGGEIEDEALRMIREEEDKKKAGILEPDIKVFKNEEQSIAIQNFRAVQLNFEAKDNYQYHQSQNDELQAQLRYQKSRNKEVAIKREDEEMVNMMKQWSQNKARMEREMNRKIESAKYGNQFRELQLTKQPNVENDRKEIDKIQKKHREFMTNKRDIGGFSEDENEELIVNDQEEDNGEIELDNQTGLIDRGQNPYRRPLTGYQIRNQKVEVQDKIPLPSLGVKFMNDTDYRGLEEKMNQKHVNNLVKLHGHVLNLQKEEEGYNKLPPENSMSIWGQQNSVKSGQRPFSAILASEPLDKIRQEQIKEIEEIKLRLAKDNVYVPVNKLVKALLVPDCHNPADAEGKLLAPPGAGFWVNPHEKKKKKKGKGKGKKKSKN